MDYTIFYKESFENGDISGLEEYDYFFSGYDECERTKTIFKSAKGKKKIWIIFPHYNISLPSEFDSSEVYQCKFYNEDEAFIELFKNNSIDSNTKICIDITGFIRPHLIFFIVSLYRLGVKKIDFLYSEPRHYKNAEETTFSGFIDNVRLIPGCFSSSTDSDTENNLLIITAGYDDKLIATVCREKSKIKKKFCILGFPSLQPDFYQESILKMDNVKDSIGPVQKSFSPAFDPFVTAQAIDNIVERETGHSNVYLSPLSTKPQTLGIALYYLWNFRTKSVNILFPYSKIYNVKTAIGIKKTWKYTFELP